MNLLYFKVFQMLQQGTKLYVRNLQHDQHQNKMYTVALNYRRGFISVIVNVETLPNTEIL